MNIIIFFVYAGLTSQGGPKLCTDDTPQCLCQRACYPKLTTSLNPCSCEGDDKKSVAPAADPTANQNTPTAENAGAIPAVSILLID